ncbi:MAG: hypothetical protein ABI811_12380 [Acidobacteriota bacterium]
MAFVSLLLLASLVANSTGAYLRAELTPPPEVPPRVQPLHERIVIASLEAGLPPQIALDTAWRESRWIHVRNGRVLTDPNHVSFGLFGLNHSYYPDASHMSEGEAIHAGVEHLARLWRTYRSARLVHLAYLHGENWVRAHQRGMADRREVQS